MSRLPALGTAVSPLARLTTAPVLPPSPLAPLPRKWTPYPVKVPGLTQYWFRVLHWNMLADGLAQSGQFLNTPPENLTWENRRDAILNEIIQHDPDLVSLVECNHNHFHGVFWTEMRRRGYGCMFTPSNTRESRTRQSNISPTNPKPDVIGNAIFYHKGRFIPMLWAGADTASTYPWANHVVFRDKLIDKSLIFVAAHFTSKQTEEAQKARQAEAYKLLKTVAELRNGFETTTAVVMAGDFNAPVGEPEMERFTNSYGNAYEFLGPRYTTWKQRPQTSWNPQGGEVKRVIDYVFYDSENIGVMSALDVPEERDINPTTLLPGTQYPSDHMSLVVDFTWRTAQPSKI